MTVPTALSVKLKFPEFNGQTNTSIEFAIEEAGLSIDDTWINDSHQSIAYMYLVGHYLMVSIAQTESSTGQRLKSESMDGMSKTYETPATRPDPADYTTTTYGSRYLELVKINQPGILLI